MGRRRKAGTQRIFRLTLRLWVGEDDDLIAFFDTIPTGRRIAALKSRLRSGQILQDLENPADLPTEEDLDDLVSELML